MAIDCAIEHQHMAAGHAGSTSSRILGPLPAVARRPAENSQMRGNAAVVVLPTYNEVANIEKTVEAILASRSGIEVLVVDDSSPDGTALVVLDLQLRHPGRIHLLERPVKDGLGGAYRAGFAWALDRHYEIIVQMDADGSHPADRLPALIDALDAGAVDVAVGSRYIPGGATENWPVSRRLLSRSANLYARKLLHLQQRDVTGGFRAWRRSALVRIDPARTTTSGYGLLVEMAMLTHESQLKVRELPITFVDRVYGDSKMDGAVAIEGLRMVLRLRRSRRVPGFGPALVAPLRAA